MYDHPIYMRRLSISFVRYVSSRWIWLCGCELISMAWITFSTARTNLDLMMQILTVIAVWYTTVFGAMTGWLMITTWKLAFRAFIYLRAIRCCSWNTKPYIICLSSSTDVLRKRDVTLILVVWFHSCACSRGNTMWSSSTLRLLLIFFFFWSWSCQTMSSFPFNNHAWVSVL